MSRRRYMGGTYGLLPTDINDLRTWKNLREDTLLDITYRDNKSNVIISRVNRGFDYLYKEIRVKPGELYKVVFSYEVGSNKKPFRFNIEEETNVSMNIAYYLFGLSPEQKTVTLYFIPKTEKVKFRLGFVSGHSGSQFVIGDITMSEEELPTIIEDDAHRDVRVLTSGTGGTLEVTHTDNRIENIPLPVGLNTISLPEEVQKIIFAGSSSSGEKNAILWADLGNVKIKDVSVISNGCNNLNACYGVNLTAGSHMKSTFNCENLEFIGKLDFINITESTFGAFRCYHLKSVRIQNLGAKLKRLDLIACGKLSIESIEYMVDNSAVPFGEQCDVILNQRLLSRIPEELKNKAKDRRVILRKL